MLEIPDLGILAVGATVVDHAETHEMILSDRLEELEVALDNVVHLKLASNYLTAGMVVPCQVRYSDWGLLTSFLCFLFFNRSSLHKSCK